MMRLPVSSSRIKAVGYDKLTGKLEVEFPQGGVFVYYEVPHSVYVELLTATSIGRYFNTRIRGAYDYEKAA